MLTVAGMEDAAAGRCRGCSTPLPAGRGGPPRVWCSERCRKASYGDPCVGCGTRTQFGAESSRVPEPRCRACAATRRTVWTRATLLDAIRAWTVEHGSPPAMRDWKPWAARQCGDEARAVRFETAGGRWPSTTRVINEFVRWNAAIVAAGYEPRSAHGGHRERVAQTPAARGLGSDVLSRAGVRPVDQQHRQCA